MEPANEGQLVARVNKSILDKYPDAWVLKTHGGLYQRAGIPDLLVCAGGVLFGFEMKHRKPGESLEKLYSRVTLRQQQEIHRLNEAGAVAVVAYSVDQVLSVIDDTLNSRDSG